MRVSSNLEPLILDGIQQSQASVETALQQLSTGRRVTLPGDDPTAAALSVRNLAQSSSVDQYTKNVNASLGQVQTADSVLTSVESLLTKAITLGTQGANGTNTDANRQVIATQVQGVLESIVSNANTTYQGSAVFAGTAQTASAFVLTNGSYTYQGDQGVNKVQVGANLGVQVNVPGDRLFNNSQASVFGSLQQLVTALGSGSAADIGAATASVNSALNYLSVQHSVYGNSINQLNTQESFLGQEKITLSSQANDLTGIDYATAAENLAQAQAQNSAVLAAAAKVLPTTLLDYLK